MFIIDLNVLYSEHKKLFSKKSDIESHSLSLRVH